MGTAALAKHLRTKMTRTAIFFFDNGVPDRCVKAWPTTSTAVLGLRLKQQALTALTRVGARLAVVPIDTRKRALGALLTFAFWGGGVTESATPMLEQSPAAEPPKGPPPGCSQDFL